MTLADRIDMGFPAPRSLTAHDKASITLAILDRARGDTIRQSCGIMTREAVELSGQIQALRMALEWGLS